MTIIQLIALSLAAVAGAIDLRCHRIPNWLTLGGACAAVAVHGARSGGDGAGLGPGDVLWLALFTGVAGGLLALVFPLLLLVVMGIIDWGLVFTRYQVLFNAAREGARVSVLPGYVAADVTARNVTTVVGTPAIVDLGAGCISVRPVTVSYIHSFMFLGGPNGGIMSDFGSSLGTKTLSATASMRDETAAVACP